MARRILPLGLILVISIGLSCLRPHARVTCPNATPPRSALAWGPASPNDVPDVRGRVVDIRTGTPLASAIVSIEPGQRLLSTDSLGEFRVPELAPGRYLVRVRRIGYDEARDSVTYGALGLRLFGALAAGAGIVDFVCSAPAR